MVALYFPSLESKGYAVFLYAALRQREKIMIESMLADPIQGPFAGQKFKFHQTDPATGKHEAREIGG